MTASTCAEHWSRSFLHLSFIAKGLHHASLPLLLANAFLTISSVNILKMKEWDAVWHHVTLDEEIFTWFTFLFCLIFCFSSHLRPDNMILCLLTLLLIVADFSWLFPVVPFVNSWNVIIDYKLSPKYLVSYLLPKEGLSISISWIMNKISWPWLQPCSQGPCQSSVFIVYLGIKL